MFELGRFDDLADAAECYGRPEAGREIAVFEERSDARHRCRAHAIVATKIDRLVPALVCGVEVQRIASPHEGERHAVGHAVIVHGGHDGELGGVEYGQRLVARHRALGSAQGEAGHGGCSF